MLTDETAQVVALLTRSFPDLGGEVCDATEARALLAAMPRATPPVIPLASVHDTVVPVEVAVPAYLGAADESWTGVPVRIYQPQGAGDGAVRPLVVLYHGGGFVLGSVAASDPQARRMAEDLDAVVVSVDYRLAPEHRFPAGLRDAYAALVWAAGQAASLGADPERLVVAGDSAGGGLAAGVALVARDEGGPAIALQLLLYPVLDGRCDSDSYRENATGYFLTAAHMRWFWEQYLGPDGDPLDPLASPLLAPDLAGLAPAYVATAEHDPLRDEGAAYAARLAQAGVAVDHRCFDGLFHGFYGLGQLLDAAAVAHDEIVAEVRRTLGYGQPGSGVPTANAAGGETGNREAANREAANREGGR